MTTGVPAKRTQASELPLYPLLSLFLVQVSHANLPADSLS